MVRKEQGRVGCHSKQRWRRLRLVEITNAFQLTQGHVLFVYAIHGRLIFLLFVPVCHAHIDLFVHVGKLTAAS